MKVSDIEVTYKGHYGTDLDVVNAARVSFDKESDWENAEWGHQAFEAPNYLKESDTKLINYLARHKHFSPFNHTFLSFRIKAPIFVARQLVKHRFMPWNEVSRRYVDSEPEFYVPDLRGRAENVKQGSANHGLGEQADNGKMILFMATEAALNMYNDLLLLGTCPEQARMVLPQNTMTEWIWSGTLGAFADMLRLRLDPHAQAESRIVAELIKAEVEKLFPVSIKALLENNGT